MSSASVDGGDSLQELLECLRGVEEELRPNDAAATAESLLRRALAEEESSAAALDVVIRWSLRAATPARPSIRGSKGRPGPDLVVTIAVVDRRNSPTAPLTSFDVACAIRGRLTGAATISHMLLDVQGLLVTSTSHAEAQRERGLRQCAGCGGFFMHPKGLATHQQEAKAAGCSDAAHTRESELAKHSESSAEEFRQLSHPQTGETGELPVPAWALAPDHGGGGKRWRSGDSNSGCSAGMSKLLSYARDGCLEEMRSMAERGVDIASARDRHGSGALLWAAGGGHLDVCRWLIESVGMEASASKRKDGRTGLHWAARNGHLAVCRYLLGQGADPHALTYDGDSCFMLAVWQGHIEVCRWLVEECFVDPHTVNRWGCNAIFKACRMDGSNSSLDVLKYVHGLGVTCDLINTNGHSPLHKAAIYGREDVCDYLLQHTACSARVHVLPGVLNEKPSHMAYYNGFHKLAAKLSHVEALLSDAIVVYRAPTDYLWGTHGVGVPPRPQAVQTPGTVS